MRLSSSGWSINKVKDGISVAIAALAYLLLNRMAGWFIFHIGRENFLLEMGATLWEICRIIFCMLMKFKIN